MQEEELWLLYLCSKAYQNKWAQIKQHFNNRTDNQLKNEYHSKILKNLYLYNEKLQLKMQRVDNK